MTFILIKDEQKCNFCTYWTGMRKTGEDFLYVDFDTAEWGVCLHPDSVLYGRPMASCESCSSCKNMI